MLIAILVNLAASAPRGIRSSSHTIAWSIIRSTHWQMTVINVGLAMVIWYEELADRLMAGWESRPDHVHFSAGLGDSTGG
jgi:hypothetical protein